MPGKKLEAFRKWFTPRRRFWAGIGCYVIAVFGPLFYPGLNGYWGCVMAPGTIFLCSTWTPKTDHKC